uniref:RHD domain-containing protein n=1 Tax=Scylla olivacea TaxID=85551 RepID=A0A0P4VSZ2_SCYOL
MVPQAVVEGQVNLKRDKLKVDLSDEALKVDLSEDSLNVDLSEEAQELPASQASATATTHTMPPLVSFRDVSLLSSLHQFKGNNSAGNPAMLRVDGGAQTCVSSKVVRPGVPHSPPPLTAQLSARSSDGSVELKLVTQPEEQHRARYQTEGSRGAVKDRSGSGHPTVKLVGYSKPTTLQIFVGSDTGKSGPHMFYQVCRVSGKNSTPCRERRVDGTVVIEAALHPENEMTMSCDCVGILKERNVDVEHRFKAVMSRGRKKSTKCRLVFRTFITLPSGAQEVLQVVSQPIACTQPPGVPEICRKSISSCLVTGGEQIFIFGKNFLKDTVVVFQQHSAKAQPIWEEKVLPDKDSLQPIHLIVAVPKYCDLTVTEEVTVEMVVVSGGKKSEPQSFTYLPLPTKKGMCSGRHQTITLSCLTSSVLAHSREGRGWSSCGEH